MDWSIMRQREREDVRRRRVGRWRFLLSMECVVQCIAVDFSYYRDTRGCERCRARGLQRDYSYSRIRSTRHFALVPLLAAILPLPCFPRTSDDRQHCQPRFVTIFPPHQNRSQTLPDLLRRHTSPPRLYARQRMGSLIDQRTDSTLLAFLAGISALLGSALSIALLSSASFWSHTPAARRSSIA